MTMSGVVADCDEYRHWPSRAIKQLEFDRICASVLAHMRRIKRHPCSSAFAQALQVPLISLMGKTVRDIEWRHRAKLVCRVLEVFLCCLVCLNELQRDAIYHIDFAERALHHCWQPICVHHVYRCPERN